MSGISENPITVDGIADVVNAATPASQALVLSRNSRSPQGLRKYLYSALVGSVAILTTLYQTGTGLSLFGPRFEATDYAGRTKHVLSTTPLIDGHNDLPYILRQELKNRIYDPRFDFRGHLLSHTDLSKIRTGQLGGQFWSVYIECAAEGVPQLEEPTVSFFFAFLCKDRPTITPTETKAWTWCVPNTPRKCKAVWPFNSNAY